MSQSDQPLVSILIPVFNCRAWVARAVETALQQTWTNKEIIIYDDGSTDGSIEAILPYRDRVRIDAAGNGGQNVSRNRLTVLSRGEWLLYLDSDDELAPDSIEQKMRFSSAADVIYGSTEVATFQEETKIQVNERVALDFSDPWVAAFLWKYPNTSAMLFRRSAVLDVGGWNEGIQNCTDYDLYFRLLAKDLRFKAAPYAWSLYRQWSMTQAVNEAPLRKMRARLTVMHAAAETLRDSGRFTAHREQAFLDAALAVIRIIFLMDPGLAAKEHARLLTWKQQLKPSATLFPARYRFAYRLLGFRVAEHLSEWTRGFRLGAK